LKVFFIWSFCNNKSRWKNFSRYSFYV